MVKLFHGGRRTFDWTPPSLQPATDTAPFCCREFGDFVQLRFSCSNGKMRTCVEMAYTWQLFLVVIVRTIVHGLVETGRFFRGTTSYRTVRSLR